MINVAKAGEFNKEWQNVAQTLGFKHNTISHALGDSDVLIC